ncbi:MAG: TonB-dependent receptor [Bacteroidota bacterium]
MKSITLTITLLLAITAFSQTTPISGRITDNKRKPLMGVSISIKGSYDGATSDSAGLYKFSTTEKGSQTLVFSSMGYKSIEQLFELAGKPLVFDAAMKEALDELKAVVITAGSFEASDEKKVSVLKPLDIVTTASANADVAAAMKTLPGTQQIGESAELFVRGGAGYETKQFIDGTMVANPNFGQAPDLASRGRFSPFLFKGTVFSTGGYSALYGQALSSALILESIDLPERSQASASISPLFVGAQYQSLEKNKKSSWGSTIGYTNVGLYFKVVKQKPDYFHAPEIWNGDFNFRVKTSKTGMLKFYTSYSRNKLGLRNKDIDSAALKNAFGLTNDNWYVNMSYKERIANRWKLNTGLSFSLNKDGISQQLQDANNSPVLNGLPVYLSNKNYGLKNTNLLAQARVVIEHKLIGLSAVRFGTEYMFSHDQMKYNQFKNNLHDHFNAAFGEADIYITNNIAAKLGTRLEHSTLMDKWNIAPRISLAYKINKKAQFSTDYGIFYQKPQNQYLLFNNTLTYMKATHYIGTYQVIDATHTFRAQAFYKKYNQLIQTQADTASTGTGNAQGIEFFWRDKQTFKGFDYWLTYSFLDTKRNYLNYPYSLTPNFAAKHTANLVIKRFFSKINTQLNANYQFATGRPYYDIQFNNTANKFQIRDQGKTIAYNNLSFSANYLTSIKKAFAVVVFSVTNVLGSKQIYGYNYSQNGMNKVEINPAASRFYFIGIFLSWGTDRRQDAINNNL